MMRLDPARVRLLIEYVHIATVGTSMELRSYVGDVADFVRVAWDDATTAARQAYLAVMGGPPSIETAWAAVRPPGPHVPPPVLGLLRGQATDADERVPGGHLVPDPTAERVWRPFYRALETWDAAYLLRAMTPTGWRLPGVDGRTRLVGTASGPVKGRLVVVRPGQRGAPGEMSGRAKLALAVGGTLGTLLVGSALRKFGIED